MEHTKHLWRAVLILVVLLIGFVVLRHFMIPESFGKEGHFRYDSLLEFMAKDPVHGPSRGCATSNCHSEEQTAVDEGKHATVSCETCHAPLSTHVQNGEKIAPMPKKNDYMLCALCHQKLRARPAEFSQVDLMDHIKDLELPDEIPAKVCKICHDPHKPARK